MSCNCNLLGELDHLLLPGDGRHLLGVHGVPGLVLAEVPGLGWSPVLLWPQLLAAGQGLQQQEVIGYIGHTLLERKLSVAEIRRYCTDWVMILHELVH